MSRNRSRRAEALGVAELNLGFSGCARLENSFPDIVFKDIWVSRYPGIDDQLHFTHAAMGRERQLWHTVATYEVGHAEETFPQTYDLQMGGLITFGTQAVAQQSYDFKEEIVEIKFSAP